MFPHTKLFAVGLMVVIAMCTSPPDLSSTTKTSSNAVDAQEIGDAELRGQIENGQYEFLSSEDSMAQPAQAGQLLRSRRQAQQPPNPTSLLSLIGEAGQQAQPLASLFSTFSGAGQPQQPSGLGNFMGGQGAQQPNPLGNLFGGQGAQQQPNSPITNTLNAAAAFSQLQDAVRRMTDSGANTMQTTSRSLNEAGQQVGQQVNQMTQQTQNGVMGTLEDIRKRVKELGEKYPELLTDLNKFYQSVRERMSPKQQNAGAQVAEAFSPDNVAKAVATN